MLSSRSFWCFHWQLKSFFSLVFFNVKPRTWGVNTDEQDQMFLVVTAHESTFTFSCTSQQNIFALWKYFVIAVSGRAASPIINIINRLYIAICWINCSDVTALSASVMVLTKNTFQWNWFYLLFCTLLLSLANMHAAAAQSFLSWREIPGTRKNSHSSVESHLKYWYGSLSLTLTFFSAIQYRGLT